MNKKTLPIVLFLFSLIVMGGCLAVILLNQCTSPDGLLVDIKCYDFLDQKIEPIFWGFLPLLAISLILLFLRREVFMAWAKFAVPAFPIMVAILLYTYNNGPTPDGFGLAGLISDEMLATAFLPALFFIISLVIIIVKSHKLRKFPLS